MKKIILCCLLITILISCKNDSKQSAVGEPYALNQTIYYGGDILTMAGEKATYVEAVVQREGRIID